MSGYPDMHTAPGSQQLIQRCVIVQREEKGYGLTVTGDNPVFIQSVKDHGAAYKAGVQTGDRIIKVNGTLVTSSNHLEVVQMIKAAGPYVALTLLGRPLGTGNVAPQTPPPILNPALPPSGSQPTDSKRIVTSPQPVNPTQDAQVKSERLNTFKRMLDQERTLLDHTQREYSQNPSEKLQKDISGIKTRISVLEKQLQKAHSNMIHTQGSGTPPAVHPASPAPTPRPQEGQVASSHASLPWDSPNMNEEFQTIPEEQKKNEKPAESRRSWLPHGIQHARQRSSPETYNLRDHNSPNFPRSVSAGLKRNNSDAQCKESSARQKFRDRGSSGATVQPLDRSTKRKELEAIGRVKSLPGDTLEGDYEDLDTSFSGASSPGVVHGMETVTPMEGVEEARLVQDPAVSAQLQTATLDTVELCSPPTVAAEVHSIPAPSQSHSQSQSAKIMCMDEDDFQSDNEAFDEHGPFNELEQLEKKPAHMAVFLHYLISNNDPSSLFFYLVTDSYASGNLKEMKKWAYDIFSTFMGSQGPLRIQVSDNVVASVEHTINSQINNEEAMRNVFHPARMDAKEEVEDFLTEFRRQRALGLGSIFGDQLLVHDDMDRARELKIVESTLLPHLERLTTLEAEKEPKNQALAAAITTFMKQVGVKVQNSALERAPSFMNKDRRNMLSKFNRPSKKHNMKGHQFVEIQCLNTTFCQQCNGPLWGIGYQGYQCTNCEFTVHRTGLCLEQITRECSKKKSKKPRGGTIPFNPTPPPIYQMKSTNEDLSQLTHGQVNQMVGRFDLTDPSKTKQPEGIVSPLPPETGPPSTEFRPLETESKRSKVHRTGSLKSKGERKLKSDNKRSRSDVDMDNQSVTDVLTRSQASSSSSISTGQDSPRTSLEHLARQIDEDDSDMEAEASTPNWQKCIDKDIVRKMKPKEVKRQEVINELFHTERTHVRSLKVLKRVFYLPMLEHNFLPKDTINFYFPNLDEMIEVHGSLNNAMKKERRTSHVIQEVSKILLNRFDGEAGETMKRVCSTFCQNQSIAMEHLKKFMKKEKEKEKDKKEGSLSKFIDEAEANPLCRRLPLPGIIATGYQRLTKYPLLIENLLKYTPVKSSEHEQLSKALQKSKDILSAVNEAVKESENMHRLQEYNRRMDKTPVEKSTNPLVADYKNFDLLTRRLIHDGQLSWKVNRNKSIDVQVLLLEDIIVLLQKQDEKLVLKLHSTNQMREEVKTHSPIIKLSTVLCRTVATNKKAFFLVSTSSAAGPQIYELVTGSVQDRSAWMEVILHTQDMERRQPKGVRRNARTTLSQRLPQGLHPLNEEDMKIDDKPDIIEPPTVEVAPQPVVVSPQPSPVLVNQAPSEPEPTGDIRTTLEETLKQLPNESASLLEQVRSLMVLTSRIRPVLDDAVGESSENKVLVEAMQALDKQLTVMSGQQQEKEIEESRLQQENEALRLVQEKMYSEQEQLKSELTVTQHELNNLQISEDRGPPMRASADSIPDILEDGEDLSDKQQNRQSYSGDSSATESEDSKTMESSEAEEHTVVQDVEGKSFDDHDVEIPMMVQPEVQPEVGAAVACQVVNEQLSELRSAVHEQLQGPRAAAMESSGSQEQERTQENSETCTKDIEHSDPEGEGQVDTEMRGPVESGRQEVRADDSLEDAGYHGDSDNPDVTPSACGGVEEIRDANRQALLPRETSEPVPLVDENSNVGTGVDDTPMVERTLDVAETQDPNADVTTVESTEEPSLLGHGDADSSAAQVESLGDTPQEEADSDPVATEPDLPMTEWQGPPSPCHIEVVDSITNSGDLISNVERSDEKRDLGPEGEKPETIPSVGKVETIPTDVPGQTKLEVPEGDSRPASIISLDSASSDVPVGSTTDEQDDTDGEKPVEGTKTQDTPSSRNTDATSPIIV